MQREMSVERLERIARDALLGGYGRQDFWSDEDDRRLASRPRRRVHLHCEMDCREPHEVTLFARDSAWYNRKVRPMTIIVHSRCRHCPECLKRRAMFWTARACYEFTMAPTTYFGTLTTNPRIDQMVDATAQRELWARGVDFQTDLTEAERFRVRVKITGKYLTDYFKRVREGRTTFRYLCVAEMHNSKRTDDMKRFRPHWHILLHDKIGAPPLVTPDEWETDDRGQPSQDKYGNPYLKNSAFLKRQWTAGFSSFALCRTPQAAGYLCKYLTKEDSLVRIRNSFRYGGDVEDEPQTVQLSKDVSVGDALQGGNLDAPPKEGDWQKEQL